MTRRFAQIHRLERVGLATWPALEEHRDGDWVLRAAAGVTGRSNSVSPLGQPVGRLEPAVTRTEAWYRARDLETRFRLTKIAPAALDSRLAASGYHLEPAVAVMTRPVGEPAAADMVRIDDTPPDEWFAALMTHRFDAGTSPSVVHAMLDRLELPTAYASYRIGSTLAATGMAVACDGVVAIYAMHTLPAHRRSGLGSMTLQTLLAWGRRLDAGEAFLQVQIENPGGRAFYAKHGFATQYRYWYRRRGATP